jgi:hypothetical protein
MKSYFEVYGYAKSRLFNSQDFSYKGVYLKHEDGSEFNVKYALTEIYENHLIIYTEHHGLFVYPLGKVEEYKVL